MAKRPPPTADAPVIPAVAVPLRVYRSRLGVAYPPFLCRGCGVEEAPATWGNARIAERLEAEQLCWSCSFWAGIYGEVSADPSRYVVDAARACWAVGPASEGGRWVVRALARERGKKGTAHRVGWAVWVGVVPEVWATRLPCSGSVRLAAEDRARQ